MDWVLVFSFYLPLLPGLAVGLLVRIWARSERAAFLAELGVVGVLAIIAALVWQPAYGVYAFLWMALGAQAAALVPRRRATAAPGRG